MVHTAANMSDWNFRYRYFIVEMMYFTTNNIEIKFF